MRKSTPEDFWSRITKTDTCWLWTGYARRYGYVTFSGQRYATHRLAYTLSKGDVPPNLVVMHTCDNGLCCNPSHLVLGTQTDNIHDMIDKGRNVKPSGSLHHATKLTKELVLEIVDSPETTSKLMLKHNLSRSTVCRIRKGTNSCASNILKEN